MVNPDPYLRTAARFTRLKVAYEAYLQQPSRWRTARVRGLAFIGVLIAIIGGGVWGITHYQPACPPDCRSAAATFATPWSETSAQLAPDIDIPPAPSADTPLADELPQPAQESTMAASTPDTPQAPTWQARGQAALATISTIVTEAVSWGTSLTTRAVEYGSEIATQIAHLIPTPDTESQDSATYTDTSRSDIATTATTATITLSTAKDIPTATVVSTPTPPSDANSTQIARGPQTIALSAPAVCWGSQIDGVGIPGNPIITTFVQMPRRVTVVDGGCATNADAAQQLAQLQRQYPNDNWQLVAPDAPLAANAPAQQWDIRNAWHTPQAGDVCWGEGIGSENDRYGVQGRAIIVNFASADIQRYIEYGTCERNGRTFAQIERALQLNEPQRNWIAVPDITAIRSQRPQVPRRWFMSNRGNTTVDANSICWGTNINGYGIAGNPVVVGINQDNTAVDIESGACVTAYRDIATVVTELTAELPYLNWQVVGDINALAQASLASNIRYQEQQTTLTPGDVCFVLGIRDLRSDYQSRFTYGADQHGIVFRVDAPAQVFISYGICERNARTYDQLLNSMRTYESNKQWVDAGNFSNIANLPDVPHRWQSGAGTNTYNAQPGSVCWGMEVGVLRNASNRVLARFNQQWNGIPVRDGQCEYNQRSWPDIITWLTKEAYPDDQNTANDDWWVVDDYAVYGQ